MCAWRWIGATRGKRPKRRVARRGARDARTNVSADPFAAPRAAAGRAPDVFRAGAWVPMRQFDESEAGDFAVVGTGAGGAPLIARLAESGFSVVGFDAGPISRPLEGLVPTGRGRTKPSGTTPG